MKVGRVAGQFAKPRSSPTEKQGGMELPSYRGDIINGPEFTPEARIPDPRRQLEAYRQSAATLNFLRALLDGGYASLENAHRWELKFMEGTPVEARYDALADEIKRTVEINALLGMTAEKNLEMRTTSFYTSHEALLLPYEQALTRRGRGDGLGRVRGDLGPLAVDRRPHAPARRRARRVLPRHRQSDRPEVRAVAGGRRAAAPHRHPQPEGRGRAG